MHTITLGKIQSKIMPNGNCEMMHALKGTVVTYCPNAGKLACERYEGDNGFCVLKLLAGMYDQPLGD